MPYTTVADPTTELTALVYVSTAVAWFDGPAIEQMLVVAREKNAQRGLTGCLLHHDGAFMQYLEGSRQAVDTVYESIRRDSRHLNLVMMHRGPIGKRHFPGWLMASADVDRATWSALLRYTLPDPTVRPEEAWGPALLQQFLRSADRYCRPLELA